MHCNHGCLESYEVILLIDNLFMVKSTKQLRDLARNLYVFIETVRISRGNDWV